MKIGLALSGGGIRGVSHIGVLKALLEAGLEIDVLSGTSSGAIVGSLFSYGYAPERIIEIIEEIKLVKSMRMAWSWSGLLKMDGMKEYLLKFMPENNFSALKKPMTIAVTEIKLGEIQYFSQGELLPAILGSCSIPAVFSPLAFQGGLYVDGGVFENLPASPLKAQCDFLIGSHCNNIPREFDPTSIKTVVERTLLMAINSNTQASKQLCDVVIEPPGLGGYGSFDIAKAREIFEFAYQFTKANFNKSYFDRVWMT